MANTNINIRTDSALKERSEEIFAALGLNMSSAINMFLKATVRTQGIPFDLKLVIPAQTLSDNARILNQAKESKETNRKEYTAFYGEEDE